MSQGRAPERRTRVLVDPGFQLVVAARLVGLLAVSLTLFVAISLLAPVALALLSGGSVLRASHPVLRFEWFLQGSVLPLLLTLCFIFWQAIRESLRIAGPQYRFREVFRRLQRRQIPRGVKVRGADYLRDTADSLDKALVGLHDEFGELRRLAGEARRALERGMPESALTSSDLAEARRRVQGLADRIDTVELVSRAPGCQPVTEPYAPAPIAQLAVFPAGAGLAVTGE